MAERRMFTQKITESDAFLDMPLSSQALYFHLCMNADDDGFIKNPRRIARMVGTSDDDFKLLIAKKFVLSYETGIIVIKHWRMHNLLRKDRYKETEYVEEKKSLFLKENGAYTFDSSQGKPLLTANWQPTGNQLAPQDRLGKDRLGKDSIVNIYTAESTAKRRASTAEPQINTQKEEWFNEFWAIYPRKNGKKKSHDKFLKICTDELTFNAIMAGLSKTALAKAKAEGTQFVKDPLTWLNGECWNDEPYKPKFANNRSYNNGKGLVF